MSLAALKSHVPDPLRGLRIVEGTRVLAAVLSEQVAALAQVRVHVHGSGIEAAVELVDQGDVHAADEAHLAALVHQPGDGPDQEGAFVLGEGQAGDVAGLSEVRNKSVDDGEVQVREVRGHLGDRVREQEAHADDQVVAVFGHGPQ
jgi:hypothetical protein